MTKQDLQYNILNQPYKLDKWQEVLKRVFGATKLHQIPQPISITVNDIAESASELGSFYTKDEMLVGIYQIIIKDDTKTDITKSKVGLRNLLRNVYKYDVDGALIVFVQGNKWRFSYVSEIRNRDGEIVTEPKRYTYLFGEKEVCRTAADRFSKLIDKKYYLQDLYDTFSVEKLTKEFFSKYIEFYKKGVKHIVDTPEYYNLLIDKSANDLNIDENKKEDIRQKPIRDFVKKLLGRIVFLHFLQKKEWLGCPVYNTKKENEKIWIEGSKTFILDLFKQFTEKENFHSQCLSILFFETLNEKRTNNIFPISFNNQQVRIPYLNGGLFDTDFKDLKTNLPLEKLIDFPVDYFQSLLDFFEQYNFTIDENDPYETEVGIDPEMLGHIFENLLEDNRERGAFYTPKEIVHYMCQESLVEYLKTNAKDLKKQSDDEVESAILNLVRNNRINEVFTKKENAKYLNNLLKNVKVCDPAIGSGAFPMGMLKEIFECRRVIYPYLKTNEDFSPSNLKKEIIQGNIYGVDVENGAVEIARLRFWLALVVDELIPEPLPNLDYKIMQGNSLLERYDLVDLKFEKKAFNNQIKEKETDLFGNIINPQMSLTDFLQTKQSTDDFNITELEEKYFYSTNAIEKQEIRNKLQTFEKEFISKQLKGELKNLTIQQTKKQNEVNLELDASKNETEKQKVLNSKKGKDLNKLNKSIENIDLLTQNLNEIKPTQKPYFLWHLYFMDVFDKGGFDIVIGNPPYIQLQKMGADTLALERANYDTFTKTGDIYCLFYEQGFKLLKPKGVLSYITSNTWMRTKFGELVRKYFREQTQTITLLNFEDTKIFQTATVETNIIISKNNKQPMPFKAVAVKADYSLGTNIYEYFQKNEIEIKEPSDDGWIILGKDDFIIKSEIEKNGIQLKNWDVEIMFGLKTGFNEPFFINEKTKQNLINEDINSAHLIKPLLRGRDIKKFAFSFDNEYIIFTHNGVKANEKKGRIEIERIEIERNYPAIYKHLLQYKDENSPLAVRNNDGSIKTLMNRADQGTYWYNLRDCAFVDLFEKPKLIWLGISDKPAFAYDVKHYITAPANFLVGDRLKYLLVFLNSKIIEWYLDKITSSTGQGTNQWKKIYVEQLPIPKINDLVFQNKYEILADYLIYLNDNTQLTVNPYTDNASIAPVFEDVVNMMVYELYFSKHMKELDIDVLQFIDTENHFKPIDTSDNTDKEQNAEIIGSCYKWLQEQSNPIRNRIILSNIKSTDIIRRINSTTH